jgi:hypothetical protein
MIGLDLLLVLFLFSRLSARGALALNLQTSAVGQDAGDVGGTGITEGHGLPADPRHAGVTPVGEYAMLLEPVKAVVQDRGRAPRPGRSPPLVGVVTTGDGGTLPS